MLSKNIPIVWKSRNKISSIEFIARGLMFIFVNFHFCITKWTSLSSERVHLSQIDFGRHIGKWRHLKKRCWNQKFKWLINWVNSGKIEVRLCLVSCLYHKMNDSVLFQSRMDYGCHVGKWRHQKDDVRARNSTGSSVGLIVGGMKFICAKFHACNTKWTIWIKIVVSRSTYFKYSNFPA